MSFNVYQLPTGTMFTAARKLSMQLLLLLLLPPPDVVSFNQTFLPTKTKCKLQNYVKFNDGWINGWMDVVEWTLTGITGCVVVAMLIKCDYKLG